MATLAKKDFLEFAAAVLGIAAVDGSTAYGSIPEWDSIQHLRLVMECEAHYGISIPLEAIPDLKTLDDFYDRCVSS